MIRRILFTIFTLILLLPISVFGQVNKYNFDLGLQRSDVYFSTEKALVAGQTEKVYAQIHNYGNYDVSAEVIFYLNDQPLESLPRVVVRAGDEVLEVAVNFIVPAEDFRIVVQLQNLNPGDQNLLNNKIVTELFSPASPSVNNNLLDQAEPDNQTDVEEDSLIENNLLIDNPDMPVSSQIINEDSDDSRQQINETELFNANNENKDESLSWQSGEPFSNIKIVAKPLSWGKFDFSYEINDLEIGKEQVQVKWDFGDGETASGNGVYEYASPGVYYVKLKVVGPYTNILNAMETVIVPFWSIYNLYFWGVLLVCAMVLSALFLILRKK